MNEMLSKAMTQFRDMIDLDKVLDINGRKYKKAGFDPVLDPGVDKISISTLTGIVDAIEAKIDADLIKKPHIHVMSPTSVYLESDCFGDFLTRHVLIESNAYVTDFKFGRRYNSEEFVIALLSQFKEVGDRDGLIKACSAITKESIGTLADNGVSQRIELKNGLSLRSEVKFKNPVKLQPYRTFAEVEQPESDFVFRIHDDNGIACSLHEADGSAWKLEAITSIRDFFREKLPEVPVIA